MATNTAQREDTVIAEASRVLEQALQELDTQIQEYEKFGEALKNDMQNYRNTRSRWLM